MLRDLFADITWFSTYTVMGCIYGQWPMDDNPILTHVLSSLRLLIKQHLDVQLCAYQPPSYGVYGVI